MNCTEFSKQIADVAFAPESPSTLGNALLKHAAICSGCANRLEVEQSLTTGLKILATDEQRIEAPLSLRNELLGEFNTRNANASGTVISFPASTKWTRWVLAAAATLILGLMVFSARWVLKPTTVETAVIVIPGATMPPKAISSNLGSGESTIQRTEVAVEPTANQMTRRTSEAKRTRRSVNSTRSSSIVTVVASTEVKSEFVPLTYLNDATAMDSGIVVRVEIAREQLARLGLPFDLDRADEIVKADIVLGDDGVARAIRLVQ